MSIYTDAEDIVLQRRKLNIEKAEQAYAIAMNNKGFAKIQNSINQISPLLAKARVQKNKEKQAELETELSKLEKEKCQALKVLNITSLQPIFTCKKCNDTAYENSKACSCLKQATFELLLQNCGISNKKLHDFSLFDESLFGENSASMKKLKELMTSYCNDFPNINKKCLLFLGQSGTGKTFLIDCIAQRILQRGYTVLYTTAFSVNNMFLKYHTTFDDNKNLYMENLLACDILIIDDLGTEPILKNVTQEYLYSVINERKLQNKTNIISTNLTLNELITRYGERTASRIYDKNSTHIINMPNKNLRNIQSKKISKKV